MKQRGRTAPLRGALEGVWVSVLAEGLGLNNSKASDVTAALSEGENTQNGPLVSGPSLGRASESFECS